MYHGKYERRKPSARYMAKGSARRARKRMTTLVLSVVLMLILSIGGTLALLVDRDDPITNNFTEAQVSCHVTESFDGTTKSNVNVVNDSNITAYIRVKLVTYRVNDAGQHIGGTAEIPNFTPGNGWFEQDGYYYYSQPVAAGASPAAKLINSLALTGSYSDADGGKQVIEVMAEAIQSVPTSVVAEKWNVTVDSNGTLAKGGNA